jgi:hypothetical protein
MRLDLVNCHTMLCTSPSSFGWWYNDFRGGPVPTGRYMDNWHVSDSFDCSNLHKKKEIEKLKVKER